MEDLLALVVVLVLIGGAVAIGRIVYRSHKKEQERKALIKKRLDEISTRYVPHQWDPVTPQQYADAISAPKKRPPAMKKSNKTPSYASTPMTSSSTSTAGTLDIGDVITGALVLNELFGHKSESSSISSKTESSSSSWGLDDSDSRKSISDSMDSSSSWSSSDSSSSDSGPSSDW